MFVRATRCLCCDGYNMIMASIHKPVADISLPFPPVPKARASVRPGTVYAMDGGDSYIYYGQIAADESIGFFKYRSKHLSSMEDVFGSSFMSCFHVIPYSIGEALRTGKWLRLGFYAL